VFILGVPAVGLVQLAPCSGETPTPTRVRGPVAYRVVARPASFFEPRVRAQVPYATFRLCGRHRADPMFSRSIVDVSREPRVAKWGELSAAHGGALVAGLPRDLSP
jgi:hypothetical protein